MSERKLHPLEIVGAAITPDNIFEAISGLCAKAATGDPEAVKLLLELAEKHCPAPRAVRKPEPLALLEE